MSSRTSSCHQAGLRRWRQLISVPPQATLWRLLILPTWKGQWTHSQVDFPNVNSVRQYVEPRTRNLPISDVERSNFPLPDLAAILDHAREEVRNGKGSFTISGLDPGRYSAKDRAIIFLGVSSHIAEERGPQGRYGTMLSSLPQVSDCTYYTDCSRTPHGR